MPQSPASSVPLSNTPWTRLGSLQARHHPSRKEIYGGELHQPRNVSLCRRSSQQPGTEPAAAAAASTTTPAALTAWQAHASQPGHISASNLPTHSAMAPRPASQWPPRPQNSTAAVVWPGSASPGRPLQGAGPHASMAAQQSPGYIPQSPGYTPQSPLYNAQSPRYQPPPLPPSVAVGIAILSLTRPCRYREMVMHAKIFSRVTKGRTDLNSSAYEDCKVVTAWSAENPT